jgi:hypothetical protein
VRIQNENLMMCNKFLPINFPANVFCSIKSPRHISNSKAAVVAVTHESLNRKPEERYSPLTKGSDRSIMTSRPGLKKEDTSPPLPRRKESSKSKRSRSITSCCFSSFNLSRRRLKSVKLLNSLRVSSDQTDLCRKSCRNPSLEVQKEQCACRAVLSKIGPSAVSLWRGSNRDHLKIGCTHHT